MALVARIDRTAAPPMTIGAFDAFIAQPAERDVDSVAFPLALRRAYFDLDL